MVMIYSLLIAPLIVIHTKKSNLAAALPDICALMCSHTFFFFLLSPAQRPLQPWTSASFPKGKVRVPNLSWSGTSTPPARAAHASGTEAAAETRTASTRTSSVWRPVENQVNVLFVVINSKWQCGSAGHWQMMGKQLHGHFSRVEDTRYCKYSRQSTITS